MQLTLNRFHTLLWCFHIWLWKCRMGLLFSDDARLDTWGNKFRLLKKSFQIFFLKIGDNICSVFGIALTFHSFIDFIFFWDVQTLVRRVVYIHSQPISINLTYQISRSWLATFFAKTNLCCTMMDFVFSLFCVCFFFH